MFYKVQLFHYHDSNDNMDVSNAELSWNAWKTGEVVVEVWTILLFKDFMEASNLVSFICLALVPSFLVPAATISRASIAEEVYGRFDDPFLFKDLIVVAFAFYSVFPIICAYLY